MQFERIQSSAILGRLFGVRRLDAALLSIMLDRDQSGVKPPHSKEAPISNCFTTMREICRMCVSEQVESALNSILFERATS